MFMGEDQGKTDKIWDLKVEFEALNMKETNYINDFFMKLNNIVSTIRVVEDIEEKSYVVYKLLWTIPFFLQNA